MVHQLGDYTWYLHQIYTHGAILALYPTFHKVISLAHLPTDNGTRQILYLDCDTFMFADIENLFDLYAASDLYAREEHSSRLSHFGYDARHIDETALGTITRGERLRAITPFNSGVCIVNNGFWNSVVALRFTFLDFAWRLLVGRHLQGPADISADECEIHTAIERAITNFDRSRALPYPSNNHWIIEQIALWLTLGHFREMSQSFISRNHVAQNGEFHDALCPQSGCIVAHYFSSMETDFFSTVPRIAE
jgi:hypothetical protein